MCSMSLHGSISQCSGNRHGHMYTFPYQCLYSSKRTSLHPCPCPHVLLYNTRICALAYTHVYTLACTRVYAHVYARLDACPCTLVYTCLCACRYAMSLPMYGAAGPFVLADCLTNAALALSSAVRLTSVGLRSVGLRSAGLRGVGLSGVGLRGVGLSGVGLRKWCWPK